MAGLFWKISTFGALGAAAFFALHPVTTKGEAAATKELTAARRPAAGGGLLGFFGGSAPPPTDSPTGKLVIQFRGARTSAAACETLSLLSYAGDDEATSAVAEGSEAKQRPEVRVCAVQALGRIKGGAARSWLGELIADRDSDIRSKALVALALRDDPEAHRMVLDAAYSPDPEVQKAALIALGLGHVVEGTPLIVHALDSADLRTQGELIQALGESGDPAAVPVLSRLAHHGNSSVRGMALSSLGEIGGDAAARVLGAVLLEGRDGDMDAAATGLATMKDAVARGLLVAAVEAPLSDVAMAALAALATLDGPDVHDLMLRELGSSNRRGALAATRYFAVHPDASVIPALSEIVRKAPRDADDAVSALRAVGGDEARAVLADIASKNGPSQSSALSELSSMAGGREQARRIATSMVRDGGGQSANAGLRLLTEDGSPEARETLIELSRGGGSLASQAIEALSRRGDVESMKVVRELAVHAPTNTLRIEALSAAAHGGGPEAVALMADALKSTDPEVRRAALQGYRKLGGAEGERVLLAETANQDVSVRMLAVRSLAQVSSPQVSAELTRLAEGPDRRMAHAALLSLARSDPSRITPLAERQMKSGDSGMRQGLLSLASVMEPEAGRRLLVGGLGDADEQVAASAARMLGQIGGPEAQTALGDFLTRGTSPAGALEAAAEALEALGGSSATRYSALIAKYKPHHGSGDGEGDSDPSADDAEGEPD